MKFVYQSTLAILLFLLLPSGNTLFGQKTDKSKSPNIVLLLGDDLGWTDLSCYGSNFYETPNIDNLAAKGIRFTDGYSACTVCSPSRASILTGKNPARLHLTDWITGHEMPYAKLTPPDWTKFLPLQETTIAELLKKQGYVTATIGKWHLGDDVKYYPEHHGFDINIAGTYAGQPPSYFSPYKISTLKDGPQGEYLTDRLTSEAETFIEKNSDKPFFLYFPLYAVHTPIQAKKEDIEHYKTKITPDAEQKNATYAAMIKSMDESVGRIVAVLDRLNLTGNTLIVFTSDNGGLLGGRNQGKNRITSNVPLRMGKGSNYEGGIRVPLIVSWKNKIGAGGVSSVPVIGTDLFPTFAALAGSKAPLGELDGVDIKTLLIGNKQQLNRGGLFWHYPHYHPEGGTPHSAVRQGDWKLIHFYETGKQELYNLKKDISEQNDLSAKEPEIRERLYKNLLAWKSKTGAQDPLLNPRYDSKREREGPGPKKRIVAGAVEVEEN